MPNDNTHRRPSSISRRDSQLIEQRLLALPTFMICVAGFDGYFKQVNRAWLDTLGYDEETLVSSPWIDFVHPEDRGDTLAEGARLFDGSIKQSVSFENRYRCRDGSYRWLSWNALAVPEEQSIYCVTQDITELRGHQEQRRESQKLEALGRLAGGVAHDFNNILTAIMGFDQLLQLQLPAESPLRRSADEIFRAARRAQTLTGQLLAFSRGRSVEQAAVNINETLLHSESLLRRLIPENIHFEMELQKDIPPVMADPGMIDQIILNLVVNAGDSLKDHGSIRVRTHSVMLDDSFRFSRKELRPGNYVLLEVRDSGDGIPADILDKIFDPFFTTKRPGKGTGLGLSTVYGIVKQFKGDIQVDSAPGQGTTFSIYLPQEIASRQAPTEPEVSRPIVPQGNETVLLVEDNDLVRNATLETLAAYGYHVLIACDGEEGLTLFDKHRETINLVVTDVIMPALGGAELAARIRRYPNPPEVLFISGYPDRTERVLSPSEPFLRKPFGPLELAFKVRQILDDGAEHAEERNQAA